MAEKTHFVEGDLCQLNFKGKEFHWVYCGEDDPCAKIGVEPRFSLIVPMVIKDGNEKVFRNVRFPKSVVGQFQKFESTAGQIVTVARTDGSFARYSVTPTGKFAKIEDSEFNLDGWLKNILATINGGDPDEIELWLAANGVPMDGSYNGGWNKKDLELSKGETKW